MAPVSKKTVEDGKNVAEPRPQIPRSWKRAAGLLRSKAIDPLGYQRRTRKQWDRAAPEDRG